MVNSSHFAAVPVIYRPRAVRNAGDGFKGTWGRGPLMGGRFGGDQLRAQTLLVGRNPDVLLLR